MVPIISLFSFGMVVGWIIYILIRSWNTKIYFSLLGMSATYIIWALSAMAISLPISEDTLWNIIRLSGFGWIIFPFTVLIFTVQITNSFNRLQRIILSTTGLTAAVLLAFINLIQPEQFFTRFEYTDYGIGVVRSDVSIIYLFFCIYMVTCSLLILFLLGRWSITGTSRIVKKQSLQLFTAAFFTFIVASIADLFMPILGISVPSLAPLAATGWFLGLFLSVYEQRITHAELQLTAPEIMTHMRELSIVLSPEGTVLLMNAAARKVLGFDRAILGKIHIRSLASEVRFPQGDTPVEMQFSLKTKDGLDVPVYGCISSRRNQYGDPLGFFLHATPVADRDSRDGLQEPRSLGLATEKSVALRAVMTYFDEAILFVGADGFIRSEYSPFCKNLFNVQELAGRSFVDIAFNGLEKQEQESLSSIINSIFIEERSWRLDALLPMLPKQIKMNHALWTVDYRLLSVPKTVIERVILVRINSLTAKKVDIAHELPDNHSMAMVVTIISKKNAFYDLMKDYEEFFHMDLKDFMIMARTPREILYELYRSVHTFKSRFARLNMNSARDNLNLFEDILQTLLGKDVTPATILSVYNEISSDAWVVNDLDTIKRVLGKDFLNKQDIIEVDRTFLDSIAYEMETLTHGPDCIRMTTRFREMYCVRILAELREYGDYVRKLGLERMNTELDYIVEGYDLLLDSQTYRHFLESLIHIFNNIVGHGLESLHERISSGKPQKARIECHVHKRKDYLMIEIADDGHGIDVNRIREGLRLRGLEQEAQIKSSQEVLQMIFEPGFSTLMTADEVSGRGIGLFAVSQAVKQIGGKIEVFSKLGLYTRFEFELPLIRMKESGKV